MLESAAQRQRLTPKACYAPGPKSVGSVQWARRARCAWWRSSRPGRPPTTTHIGIDLSKYPLDQPLHDIEIEQGAGGSFKVLQGTKAQGLTLGEAARRFATSELAPQIVGTPKSVADQLQDYFESQACDGFILTPTVFPGTWEQFARSVVPELQKRGLFRTDYTGRTLRDHLHD